MAIKLTKEITEKKTYAQRERFEEVGDYLCTIVSTRFAPGDKKWEPRYFIDLQVDEGPALVGKQSSWALFLKDQYKSWKNPETGATITAKEFEAWDAEKVQVAVAACRGLSRDDAGEIVDDAQYEAERTFLTSTEAALLETTVGNKVVARVYINKKGYTTVDLYPASEFGGVKEAPKSAPKATSKVEPKKAAPAAPSKPSFSAAMTAAGFEFHPDDPTYVFNAETEEIVELVDFKKRLGY